MRRLKPGLPRALENNKSATKFTARGKCYYDTFMDAQLKEPGNSSNKNQNEHL